MWNSPSTSKERDVPRAPGCSTFGQRRRRCAGVSLLDSRQGLGVVSKTSSSVSMSTRKYSLRARVFRPAFVNPNIDLISALEEDDEVLSRTRYGPERSRTNHQTFEHSFPTIEQLQS